MIKRVGVPPRYPFKNKFLRATANDRAFHPISYDCSVLCIARYIRFSFYKENLLVNIFLYQ